LGQKNTSIRFSAGLHNKGWKSPLVREEGLRRSSARKTLALRKQLKEKLKSAGVDNIDIERAANKLVVRILHGAVPGSLLSLRRKGSED